MVHREHCGGGRYPAVLAAKLALFLAIATGTAGLSQAQTFTVIHDFTRYQDGFSPVAVTIDGAGVLYGSTGLGGNYTQTCSAGCGTVFKLRHTGSGWLLSTLYAFTNLRDGSMPGAVALGPDGTLYGATRTGNAFNLRPPPTPCHAVQCPWTFNLLYQFAGGDDGWLPAVAAPVLDHAGNLYGMTQLGGGLCPGNGCGTVYELVRSGGTWTENVLHRFNGSDGADPYWSGVTMDSAGNLYGTTPGGGPHNFGVVFQLTNSGGSWSENVLYDFPEGDASKGRYPQGGVILDGSGNLFGTAAYGGRLNGGTAFELPAPGFSFSLLYSFAGPGGQSGSYGKLTFGPDGALYGTTLRDGAYGVGTVFKLTPSGGGWTYTSLHDFTGGDDGAGPNSSVVFDAQGNLYGTTLTAGMHGAGVVFEITP